MEHASEQSAARSAAARSLWANVGTAAQGLDIAQQNTGNADCRVCGCRPRFGVRVFERADERWEIDVADARLIARRFDAGVLVDDATHAHGSALRAKWEADRFSSRLLADGFSRAAGDAALGQADLVAALRANPGDADNYLVYADWLSEHGDDWGQLITVQHALASLPRFGATAKRDELSRVEDELQFRLAGRLWGALGETVYDEARQRYWCDLVDATWERGFLRAVTLRGLAEDVFVRIVDVLHALPAAVVLREITLVDREWSTASIDAFVSRPWPALRKLVVSGQVDVQRVLPVLAASPIESLGLQDTSFTPADIDALARLRLQTLEITGSMPADARAKLRDAADVVTVIAVSSFPDA